MPSKEIKSGYVCITGKPNVGKSSLINTITSNKTAIVSYKSQTTRNQIKAIYQDQFSKIIFIDTPGLHFAKNKLDLFLNSQVKQAYKQSDLVLLLVDLTKSLDDED